MGTSDKRIMLGLGRYRHRSRCAFLPLMDMVKAMTRTGDDIPEMTRYAGNWGLAVSIVFIGTGGVAGKFDVERDE